MGIKQNFLRWVATLAHQLLSQVPRAPPRRVERRELFLPPFAGNTSKVSDVVIPSPRCSSTTVSLLRRPILTSVAGKQARYIDPIIDSWSDLQGKLAGVAFAPTPEAKQAAFEAFLAFVQKFNGLVESNLNHHGGKFVAGNSITVADFVVAAYAANYCLKNPMFEGSAPFTAALDATPKTKAYCSMIVQHLPHIANRTQQYPF